MKKAKLIVNNESEIVIEDGITTIGRTSENAVSFSGDSNVSRYHAEIETRGDDFWLIELGSSNGTTVNGEKLLSEKKLADGDVIVLGGTGEIIFELEKPAEQPAATPSAAATPAASAPSASASLGAAPSMPSGAAAAPAAIGAPSKVPVLLILMGVICCLAVVGVLAVVAISFSGSGRCEAKAKITSPEDGDTIKTETDVEISSENDDCVKKAIFLMDGKEFASTAEKPYTVSINPADFGDLSDGASHPLKIVFEDEKGEKIVQPGEVGLYFETLATPTPTPVQTPTPDNKPTPSKPPPGSGGKVPSPLELQQMATALLGQFKNPAPPVYKFDPQFLQEVQKRTAEFSSEGYFARAQNYNEAIKVGYIQKAGLDAPLGYILAMSRTQFKMPAAGSAEQGLWRMNEPLIKANGYDGGCEGEPLGDPKQNCAAKASGLYMKAILLNVFENDLVFAVAAFGMSTQDAAIWKGSLPADRADFWKLVKPPQRDEVVRFFAAGIVAENPQRFGLKKDLPISTLYKNYLTK